MTLVTKITTAIILLSTATLCHAQNGHWQWAVTAQDTGAVETNNVTADNAGNVYATGTFGGKVQLGNTLFTSQGETDAWLVKYDKNGQVIWARTAGSSLVDESIGVTTDANGNVYITGKYASTLYVSPTDSLLQFDSNNVYHAFSDIFIIKYNNKGELVWYRGIGSTYDDYPTAIQADSRGYIYSTGIMGNSGTPPPDSVQVYFNQDTVTVYKGRDAYLAQYDTMGNVIRVKAIGEPNKKEHISSVAIDSAGNIYIGGGFPLNLTIDNLTMVSAQQGLVGDDIFVAKLDSTGKAIWVSNASPQNQGGIYTGTVSYPYMSLINNALYIAGDLYKCDVLFSGGSQTKITAVDEKAYLAKYNNQSGSLEWAQSLGRSFIDGARSLITDKEENAYILAVWNQNLMIGKYDKTGKNIYEEYAKGSALASTMCRDNDNNIYIGGALDGIISFGPYNIQPARDINMFLAKFKSYPTAVAGAQQTGEQVNAYPNPFTDQLTISGISQGQHILITDMYGRAVYNKAANGNICTLQLGHMPPGIYHLSITGNNGVQLLHKSINKL